MFRGDLHDVLERFRLLSSGQAPRVRLTDCPWITLIDELIEAFSKGDWDYLANCIDDTAERAGCFDAEVFCADLLSAARKRSSPQKGTRHAVRSRNWTALGPFLPSTDASLLSSHRR